MGDDPYRPPRGGRAIRRYAWPGGDIRADLRDRYGYEGALGDIYAEGSDRLVHKWHHYLPLYDRYLGPWRGRPVRFLEIGVSGGGSLSMWRRWLGPEAQIWGIDIDPACARFDGPEARVRIGSQADAAFLAAVVDEMGGVDVVLDDGSHVMSHIRASLDALLPRLAAGGLYMIEDLHTAYWPGFEGGRDAPGNVFGLLRELSDDLHHWYHPDGRRHPHLSKALTGLHIHDSVAVLEKAAILEDDAAPRPVHSKVRAR